MERKTEEIDNRLFVKTTIFDQDFVALLDTGSMVTMVSEQVARWLQQNHLTPHETSLQVKMADGSMANITESYEFFCNLNGNHNVKVRAMVLSGLTTPLVLGMDIIQKYGLVTLNVSGIESRDPVMCHASLLTELSVEEGQKLREFLEEELPKFQNVEGRTNLIEHRIVLKPEVTPVKQRYYPLNPNMQKILNEEIDRMLTEGVIEATSSPWNSPIVLVKKPSGRYRACLDLRKPNALSVQDAYPLPRINHILEKLRNANYISTLDLKDGYWQIPLAEDSRPVTAFTVPGRGLFQFKVMPFGLHSAPATFQRLLDTIITPEYDPHAFAYLDDIVVVSQTFDEHLKLLKEIFSKLREAGLKINPEKCHFCRKELKYLGHIVSNRGIQTDPEKVKAIQDFPRPKTLRQVRGFLGMASWYRRFIPNFALLTAPLTRLLKKNSRWDWTDEQNNAFQEIKRALATTTALSCPDFTQPFILQVDASDFGLGAALSQRIDKNEIIVAFASRLLSESEKKFTVTEKECLAMVWAIRKFRPYLEGSKFTTITDHQALRWLMNLEKPSGRLARWVLELQQHDFSVQYRKGSLNCIADALSRNPCKEDGPTTPTVLGCGLTEASTMKPTDIETTDIPTGRWYQKMWAKVEAKPARFPDYVINEGQLYRRNQRILDYEDPTLRWRLCVPETLRGQVLAEVHDNPTAGHLGTNKSIQRLAARYFWPGWRKDVRNYVRKCEVCQRYKVEQQKPAGKLNFRRPKGPWYIVASDIIGPLPRSKRGHRFIVVFQDTYSKWVELAPMKTATAKQVAQKFSDLILYRFGAPEILLTDNGSQYVSHIFSSLAKAWNIERQFTAPYSPQANPTERSNRVIKTMISQYVKGNQQAWDEHLEEFRFALNTSSHDSTKFTPAMLNVGRELKMPNMVYGKLKVTTKGDSLEKTHDDRLARFTQLKQTCEKNLRAAYNRQARYYNLRRRDPDYQVGDRVLRRTHILSSAADYITHKLAPKYDGPYSITEKIGTNIFRISDENGRDIGRVHVKDVKPYYS